MFDATGVIGCDSADARLALRAAVGMEEVSSEILRRLDADNDNQLTASDARLLLRLSVELEDENELMFEYFSK